MAGNDILGKLCSLIGDFASENSCAGVGKEDHNREIEAKFEKSNMLEARADIVHLERRMTGLKKRMEELRSELESANEELEYAKRLKKATEQELGGYEVKLASNEASIQALEAKISLLREESSTVRNEMDALKNEEGSRRDQFIRQMLDLNEKIRKFQKAVASNSEKEDCTRVTVRILEDMLADINSLTATEEEEYLTEQNIQKQGPLSELTTKMEKLDTESGSSDVTDTGSGDDTDTRSGSRSPRRVFKDFSMACLDDDDWQQQRQLYYRQFMRTEGFEIEWDKFDYLFDLAPVYWSDPFEDYELTFGKMARELTVYAIDQHNQEKGTNLALVELVAANYRLSAGIVLFITFLARDLSASDAEPRLYQTRIWWEFCEEIKVRVFRPRPTDQEMDAIEVPPLPLLRI